MKVQHILSVILLLLVAAQVNAGWIIQQKVTVNGEKETVTLYFQKNKMKTTNHAISIVNLEEEKFYTIMPEQKMYMVMTPDDISKMRAGIAETVPTPQKVEVKETGETATIAGHSTKKYQVWVDGVMDSEVWLTKDIDFGSEFDMAKLSRLTEKMSGQSAYKETEQYQDLMKLGFPLKQVEITPQGKVETEVIKAEKKDISDSEFQIPTDFRGMNVGDMGKMMGR
jgi:hypothetical protein